jgi:hypothetical protein
MVTQIDLKEIERKAYRSTYEDGLWNIYLGLVVAAMAIFFYRPEGGYRTANILLAILVISLLHGLFRAAKRLVTLPRIGLVRFWSLRKLRKAELAAVLGLIFIVQVVILFLSLFGWLNTQTGSKFNSFLVDLKVMDLLVACLGATFVDVGMAVTAYFNDFTRPYIPSPF